MADASDPASASVRAKAPIAGRHQIGQEPRLLRGMP
jgi:hypothetical protein